MELCLIALKFDPNLKENWLVLSKMTWRIWNIFVYRLKNSDFILESKMVELNQKKNSKQPDRADTVWNLYFTSEINESSINKTLYTCSTELLFLMYKKIFKKVFKLGSFLQCSGHIVLGHDGCIWKINLRILWNHIMKNLQLKHGQCDSMIFPRFLLKVLSNC